MEHIRITYGNNHQQPVVSSLQIAEDFGIQHKHVLETIENIKVENSAVTELFCEIAYKAGKDFNMEKAMENLELHIIDNTKEAQNEFGHMWGSTWNQITLEQIEQLKAGKQLAFSDGEYSHFISLEKPKGQ